MHCSSKVCEPGGLGSCAYLAEEGGFAAADSVRGEALQIPEDVPAAPSGIDNQPEHDLLPLSFKGVLVGTSPAQNSFSPLLLAVQRVESCCWIGDTSDIGKHSRYTIAYPKDA